MSETRRNNMQYVKLGNSSLKISRIILGTMQYGDKGWQEWLIDDEEETMKHIKFAYDHGIQTFDTANLGLPREELVIMTKVCLPRMRNSSFHVRAWGKDPDDIGLVNQHGLSRKHIFDSVQQSLERLQVDYVDLLQCHRFDYDTPIEETMQALHDVVQAGWVRYIGMSSCFAYQFHAMQNYAINNNLTPFVSMQNHNNLPYREDERELYPTLKMSGVASIPWSPLARGLLSRPFREQSHRGETDWFIKNYQGGGTEEIIKRVEEIANRRGVTMAQISIAWNLSKDGVTAPVVGTTSLKNLKDIIDAVELKLSEEEIKHLEEPYQPRKPLGHK
ncbi:NADP-dependent oxidoreductase domain superfamily protein [Abortiporus biennis]